ncbi:MAG: DMT family transporter [Bacteroidota bacterium]|nr:DMT family transporter [Bacteroidota bacterium]
MSSNIGLLGVAMLIGGILVVQAGMNSKIQETLNNPLASVILITLTSTIVGLILLAAKKFQIPDLQNISKVPWWAYLTSLLGVAYLIAALVLVKPLGNAQMFIFIVAGQILVSLVADHYGWFGFDVKPFNLNKGVSLGLLVACLYFMQRK